MCSLIAALYSISIYSSYFSASPTCFQSLISTVSGTVFLQAVCLEELFILMLSPGINMEADMQAEN